MKYNYTNTSRTTVWDDTSSFVCEHHLEYSTLYIVQIKKNSLQKTFTKYKQTLFFIHIKQLFMDEWRWNRGLYLGMVEYYRLWQIWSHQGISFHRVLEQGCHKLWISLGHLLRKIYNRHHILPMNPILRSLNSKRNEKSYKWEMMKLKKILLWEK